MIKELRVLDINLDQETDNKLLARELLDII